MAEDKCNEVLNVIAEDCGDVAGDYLEVGLDSFLDESFLKEIPVVKTVYALIKTPISLWNAYSMQKLIYFCYHMKDIPKHERIRFVNKAIYHDKNFGKKLLLTIEKIDDVDKMQMLILLFRAYGHRDGIDYDTFRKLSLALENVYIKDLTFLKESIDLKKEYVGGESAIALSNIGFTLWTVMDSNCNIFESEVYSITPLGEKFYECVFTDKYKVIV